jgi:hypothetical protein
MFAQSNSLRNSLQPTSNTINYRLFYNESFKYALEKGEKVHPVAEKVHPCIQSLRNYRMEMNLK